MNLKDKRQSRTAKGVTELQGKKRLSVQRILAPVAAGILISGCAPWSELQDLQMPSGSPHIRALDPHGSKNAHIEAVWGIPVLVMDDFVPDN
jgi:hypothetical protein